MKYDLDSYEQAQALMTSVWPKVREALVYGKKLTLEIKDQKRSEDQNSKYHAMLGEIAEQASHLGSKWDAEDWKRLLVQEFCKEKGLPAGRVIPNLSGDGICQLGQQTRHFSKEQASEFVEWLHAWGAENGITFTETK